MKSAVSPETWHERITDSRTRRERYLWIWEFFARLYTNGYRAVPDKNDDKLVTFPSGDQIKASLIFRNIEQTLALLEVPEIGVRATATDFARGLGAEDTHRESVVEQALYGSLLRSGLVKGAEEVDYIKRDGIIVGHGIDYVWWREVEQEVTLDQIPVYAENDAGGYAPHTVDGTPAFEPVRGKRLLWAGVQDEHVSPTEFLFDAGAKRIEKSPWHGFERPTKLALVKQNPRYRIADDIVGTDYVVRDLYGVEGQPEETITDAVMLVVIWDKVEKELLTFLETAPPGSGLTSARSSGGSIRKQPKGGERLLLPIAVEKWPLTFSHPDDSPFRFYVPIPANDHPFGISQIEHARNQAVEADKLRTRQANITRQIKRIPWYRKGRVDADQLQEALRSEDMKPVGLDILENEKPEALFGELPFPKVDSDIYKQYVIAEQGIDKTTGVSDVPGGGADTATEAEHIFDIGNARPRRKKRLYLKFLTACAGCHRDYLREFAPEGETVVVPDVDGRPLTLAYGRAAFEGQFDIEVVAGGGAMAISPVKQKLMIEATNQLMGKFGPMFDRVFLRQLLTMFDFRDINELMRAAMMGMGLPAPGAVPTPGYSPNNYSNAQTVRAGVNAPSEGPIAR